MAKVRLKCRAADWDGKLPSAGWTRPASRILALVGILSGCLVASAGATTVFDTTSGGGTAIDSMPLVGNNPLGDSFLTSASGETLTSVGLDLTLTGAASGGFHVYLEPNSTVSSSPEPNSTGQILLGSFLDTSLSQGVVTLKTLNVNQVLGPSTRYWIVLTYGGRAGTTYATTSVAWVYQSTLSSTGLDNADAEYNSTGGTTYSNTTYTPYEMTLSGTVNGAAPVPEPGALALLAMPILMLYFARRSQRPS